MVVRLSLGLSRYTEWGYRVGSSSWWTRVQIGHACTTRMSGSFRWTRCSWRSWGAGVRPEALAEVRTTSSYPPESTFAIGKARRLVSYDVQLWVAAASQVGMERLSLLGRDILDQHFMVYAPRSGRLELYR